MILPKINLAFRAKPYLLIVQDESLIISFAGRDEKNLLTLAFSHFFERKSKNRRKAESRK